MFFTAGKTPTHDCRGAVGLLFSDPYLGTNMAKSATLAELQELHKLIAQSLNERIKQDMEDKLPTDAATLGAAIKFLKDNNVSADPADADDLSALRDKLREQADQRRANRGNVVQLATADLKQLEG